METWRAVVGWTGVYEVSSGGAVRSVDRRLPVINRFGKTEMRFHRGKQLTPSKSKKGYLMVSLTRPGPVREYAYVHHIVADAFLGPCPAGLEICHDDGTRDNNADTNLYYGTRSVNALDRHRHGTMNQAFGEAHSFHKLTESDVLWIRAHAGSMSQRDLGEMFGVAHSVIGSVQRGTAWRHV